MTTMRRVRGRDLNEDPGIPYFRQTGDWCKYCNAFTSIQDPPHVCYDCVTECTKKGCKTLTVQTVIGGNTMPCADHRCDFVECLIPIINGSIYCKKHKKKLIRANFRFVECNEQPYDQIFLGILYKRKVICKDMYFMILKYLKYAYLQHEIRLQLERHPYLLNEKTGNYFPECDCTDFVNPTMCIKHFNKIEIPKPMKTCKIVFNPKCEKCIVHRKDSC